MRTIAKVVGIGARKSGISNKTHRAYDFTPFHLIYKDKSVEGAAAAAPLVDQSVLDPISLPKVGDEIDIVCHFVNGSMTVDAIL